MSPKCKEVILKTTCLMSENAERVCITFCEKTGNMTTETYQLMETSCRDGCECVCERERDSSSTPRTLCGSFILKRAKCL
jgi:hypothetical protein